MRGWLAIRLSGTALFLAPWYKSVFLRNTDFIGITGSCAKTTTKDLVGAVLASRLQGKTSRDSRNLPGGIARTILRLKPADRFCAIELSGTMTKAGSTLQDMLRLVRPKIGIVTNVGTDHLKEFRTPEKIAEVKGQLIESLPRDGVAVLNADDERVLAMRSRCVGKVVTCGLTGDADVQAIDVRSEWPDPLSLTVVHQGETAQVATQLHGEFWAQPVLSAIATGLALDVPLAAAAAAVKDVRPFAYRMEPVARDDGVDFLCDCEKTPIGSVPLVFEHLKKARAERKIIVVGTLSDYPTHTDTAYHSVARQAMEAADIVVFVGQWAGKVVAMSRKSPPGRISPFPTLEGAAVYLGQVLRPGDLVLLKGGLRDGLPRLIELSRTAGLSAGSASAGAVSAGDLPAQPRARDTRLKVVVGLGNPGRKYRDTPHNVGHRTLDRLADRQELAWRREGRLDIADAGDDVLLVKPMTPLNVSGREVFRLSQTLGFAAEDLIVVYDDADSPFGSVRFKQGGTDGGHRGLGSVINAFGSFEVKRIKIGVSRSENGAGLSDHVLTDFDQAALAEIDEACGRAVTKLDNVLTQ